MQTKRGVVWAALLPSVVGLGLAACAADSGDASGASDLTAADSTTLCGNGVRDTGEQCDDGNRDGLDGCSAACTFEQFQRMNSITMMFNTDSLCTANALGKAIGSQAQSRLQQALTDAINNNQLNVLFSPDGLTDLTGQTAASLSLGSFVGTASQGSTAGLDAWYTVAADHVAVSGASSTSLPAQIANGQLTAGPGNLAFSLALGGANGTEISLSNTRAKSTIGSSSVPTASTGGSPGHVAAEHLDPTLKSFATTSAGQLCGNASAASLAAVPVPAQLAQGSSTSCSQGYTTSNSMLDVLVGGCGVFIVTVISATQPDQVDSSAGAVGAGGPYKLVAGSNHKVSGCKDRSGASVDLSACLHSAAYSAGFKFTTQRAIVKGTTTSSSREMVNGEPSYWLNQL